VVERAGIGMPSVGVAQGQGFSLFVLYHSDASRAILIVPKNDALAPVTDMPRHVHFHGITSVQFYGLRVARACNEART